MAKKKRRRRSARTGGSRGQAREKRASRESEQEREPEPSSEPDSEPDSEPEPAKRRSAKTSAPLDREQKRRQRRRIARRRRVQQIVRRTMLSAILVGLVVLPLSQLQRARDKGKGLVEIEAPTASSAAASAMPGAERLGRSVSGSVWSIALGGLEVADPLAAVLAASATHGAIWMTAALLPLLLTLLLGRVFCGWICPARLPVELAAWFRRRTKRRFALSLPWLGWVKYGVLASGLLLAAFLGWNLLALVFPPAVIERETLFLITYGMLGWGALFLLGAFVADLFVDRGAWCRGFCPGGALYSLVGRVAPVRIDVHEDRCIACHKCNEVCPLGLEPETGADLECDRCGLCQTVCKSNALTYRIRIPGRRVAGGRADG